MHIVHKLPLLALYMQHTSKLQGSAVEDFIQLTAFSLCCDKDELKQEPIAGYQYTVHVKVIKKHTTFIVAYQYRIFQ